MNRDFVLSNLKEAQEALGRTIQEMERDTKYDVGELWVELQHIYHHINFAWNGREASPVRSKKDFKAWSQYPDDIAMME